MAKIEAIEGIGAKFGDKLRKSGVRSLEKLLDTAGAKKGRKALADITGIDEGKLLEWVNRADLFRIKGVSSQYSDLLEAAGVDTVKELKTRVAANLTAKMKEVNTVKKLVRQVPSASQVEKWVKQAAGLEPKVSH